MLILILRGCVANLIYSMAAYELFYPVKKAKIKAFVFHFLGFTIYNLEQNFNYFPVSSFLPLSYKFNQ